MFNLIAGLGSVLGGLFGGGDKSAQNESYERDSNTTQTASTTDLSPELLKALEAMLGGQLGGLGTANDAMGSRIAQLLQQAAGPGFDVSSFATGITNQAASAAGLDLESGLNGMASDLGGANNENSMQALLANKLRNQTAANLGGIAANATATGEQIRLAGETALTEGIGGLSSGLSQSILGLIDQTRGAKTSGTATATEKTTGKGRVTGTSKDGAGSIFGNIFKILGDAKEGA